MTISFSDVNERVFHIRVNNSQFGTAFRLDNNGKRLLVTAKHLFLESANKGFLIELGELNQNSNIEYVPIPNGCAIELHPFADIAIIDITPINGFLNLSFSPGLNYLPRQYDELFFLGFPTNCKFNNRFQNSKYPLPFLKSMMLSSKGIENSIELLYLDTVSTGGFSGSPVLLKVEDEYKVVGVQVANVYNPTRTIEPNTIELINGIYSKENSHIAIATIIDYILTM